MPKQKNEIFNITKVERKKVKGLKNTMAALKKTNFNKPLFAAIVFVYIVLIAINVFDALISKEILFSLTESGWARLAKFAIIYCIISIISRLLSHLQSYLTTRFNSQSLCALKIAGYNRVNEMTASCFANNNTATFTSRLQESHSISILIIQLLNEVHILLVNIAYSIVFITTTPILFALLAFFYIIRIIVLEFIIPKHQAIRKKNKEIYDSASNIAIESIRGALDMKGLGIEDNMTDKFTKYTTLSENNNVSIGVWRRNRTMPLYIFTAEINSLIFMLLAAHFGLTGTMTAGAILFAWTYKPYVNSLFSRATDMRDLLAEVETSSARYMELFDEKLYPIEKFGSKTIDVCGNIEFKNVTFYYNKQQPVLKDINLKIEANKTTAFVGKTGCGKSTTLSLIARFYDPKKGIISLDGTNIKKLSKSCLRNAIAYVQQSPYIFNATFKENLRLVKPDATDEELENACKLSEIHDFIMTTEKKYDTLLGENGINLSGGQKQRLAIARAFLNDAKIIMFDESTSSLDNENQAKIQKAISNLAKDHTIIVVAHRLSTIINADKIIFIKDNTVEAEGTHSELMKICEDYKELYKIENEEK